MSDTVSSATKTIATSLTDIEVISTMTAAKTVALLILFITICCCFAFLTFPVNPKYHHRCTSEDFTNTTEPDSYNSIAFNKFQKVPLTAPDTTDNTPLNLLFGQASRRITDAKTTIEISANLYVLDGNVYDKAADKLEHSYKAYIQTQNNDVIDLGVLNKRGDGIYYLTYSTSKNIMDFLNLVIKYEQKDVSIDIIQGKFINAK
jgi:NADH:ubiquinone oxidoreductase subunit B-like Fe-S oxidoreductase